jgi:hypothetical protein
MSTSTQIAPPPSPQWPRGVWQMNRNLQPPRRLSRSLARPHETEREMWSSYLIVAGAALGLIAVWVALVLLAA